MIKTMILPMSKIIKGKEYMEASDVRRMASGYLDDLGAKDEEIQKLHNQMMDNEQKFIAQKKEMQQHIDCLQEELQQPRIALYDEQSHLNYESDLLTTIHILSDELAKIRGLKA